MVGEQGIRLADLAEHLGAELVGDGEQRVSRVATLHDATPDALSFLTNPAYRKYLAGCRAGVIIAHPKEREHLPGAGLLHDNPYATYARAAALLVPAHRPAPGCHPQAAVDPSARLGEGVHVAALAYIGPEAEIGSGCVIGPGSVVEAGCRVGSGTRLVANVTLAARVIVGRDCTFHPGVVVGGDGFGFAREADGWVPVPQLGTVVIGDRVDIGAGTCVDRGAVEDTVIEDDVKLDNLIQIGHNCRVGARTVMAGNAGLAGTVTVGRDCMIGGGCLVGGHLTLADEVVLTGGTTVTNDISEPGVYSSGAFQAVPSRQWRKTSVRLHQLDDMARRLRALERRLGDDEKDE